MFSFRVELCYALPMPSGPLQNAWRAQAKVAILARVASGETVKAICAGEGMPCAESIQVWRRADPWFREALVEARRRGDWMRRFAFDEGKARALLARMAAGERVRDLLAKPGMPSQETYQYWRRTQVWFQEELWRLRGINYRERRRRPVKGFDPATADRMLVRVARGEPWRRMLETDPSMPCRVVAYRWRAAEPEWDKALRIAFRVGGLARERARSRARCSPRLVDEITSRIATGGSLRSLAADPDMPCARTLYAWFARWPDFAREVEEACDFRAWWYHDQISGIAERHGPLGLAATKREAAPLQRQLNRLAKRPGWKRARAERSAGERG